MLWAITLSCEGLNSWVCTWWSLLWCSSLKQNCVHTHTRALQRTTLGYHPQEHHPPPLEQGLSLVYSSPIRQAWLASEPQGLPGSAFPVLGLHVHVHATMPAGSFIWILRIKLLSELVISLSRSHFMPHSKILAQKTWQLIKYETGNNVLLPYPSRYPVSIRGPLETFRGKTDNSNPCN